MFTGLGPQDLQAKLMIYTGPTTSQGSNGSSVKQRVSQGSQGSTFHCPKCGKVYTWRVSLTRHLREECNQHPKYNCEFCPKKFKQRSSFRRHMITQHRMDASVYKVNQAPSHFNHLKHPNNK